MINNKYPIIFIPLLLIVLPMNLYASVLASNKSNKKIYLKANIGSVKNETHNADIYDINKTDTTGALGAGIRMSDNFYIDGRIVSLGNYETPDELYKEEFRAVTVSVLGKLPLGAGFDVYGSIGYGIITWEYTINNFVRVKDNGDTITGGLGIQYKIPGAEDFSVSLGYDTYYFRTSSAFGTGDDHSNTINFTSFSVQYWFR